MKIYKFIKMSCITCLTKFSFFTKENGCPNCGFSYCSKCLKYKYNIPNVGEKKICGRCFHKFQTLLKEPTPPEPSIPNGLDEPLVPIDITKKLEALGNPAKPPIVMYRQGSKLDMLSVGLDPTDQEIVNRLKKLRNEDKEIPPPPEDEIRIRLALLKDQDPNHINKPMNINAIDTRTTHEQTNDLIREYLERLEISKNSDQLDKDIQARLDNLRGIDSSKYTKENAVDMEVDDETATQNILIKALAEAALEEKFGDSDILEEVKSEPTDKDDYIEGETCVMCDRTKDLVICFGCTGDLYCPNCFEHNHDDFELDRHKTVQFKVRENRK